MKLIKELTEDVRSFLVEENGKKNMYIEGTWMQAELPNRNKRIYPMHILEREYNRYNRDYVKQNRAYGELGHPEVPKINETLISHRIVSLEKDGTNFVGKAILTDTPNGRTARGIIESGGKLGVSTRGLGSVKVRSDGINEVQDDFFLATAGDIVVDPSAPDAFVNGIMEGVEWIYENGIFKSYIIDEVKNNVNKAFRSVDSTVRQEAIVEGFRRLFSRL